MHWFRILKLGVILVTASLLFQSPAAAAIQIITFGDCNTAGFGVSGMNKYPSQLEQNLPAGP